MALAQELGPTHGVAALCDALDIAQATYFRVRAPQHGPRRQRRSPPRRLSDVERIAILEIMHEPRFIDLAPAEIHATLLQEGHFYASVRTMHRILAEHGELRERRNQLRRPNYTKPELLTTQPNQLWSWDITKLRGPAKWTYYYLYVILDVFSRYVVGWMVAHREVASLAEKLIEETCLRQQIEAGQLTIHADRGAAMTSKPVAFLMADLGVTKSHSRPYVSDDNPFSEAAFKTLKYQPAFPERFGCLEDARAHCIDYFRWYNDEHHHESLAYLTPADVHFDQIELRLRERQRALDKAYDAHPERFTRGRPTAKTPPREVWINRPTPNGDAHRADETMPAIAKQTSTIKNAEELAAVH